MKAEARRCIVSGCTRPHVAKGYCKNHYYRLKRGTDLNHPGRRRPTNSKFGNPCGVPTCAKPHFARDLCQKHYNLMRATEFGESRRCTADGCLLRHLAKGFCRWHYALNQQLKWAGQTARIIKEQVPGYSESE